ncbi:MAG: DUF2671 domain-containing protein [Rickettsiaceae bacterium]|nr:DUF2671 domain-containing protein [Rickettsiaceae bacterium]
MSKEETKEVKKEETVKAVEAEDVFSDIRYICSSTSLIVDSLQKGLDVAQLPSGDLIITEVKTINTQYSWDRQKQRMIKISQS